MTLRRLPLAALVLVAQAPLAAQAGAPDLKALEALRAENPVEAFAKAKALIPAARPAFDKATLQTAFAGIREWNAQLDLYRVAYDSGVACGQFEEAREIAGKARDMARDLQKEAMGAFNAYKETWVKAGEESAQALAELKDLAAKDAANQLAPAPAPKPDPKLSIEDANQLLLKHAEAEQAKVQAKARIAFLKSNEATLKENIEKAKNPLAPLERTIRDLDNRVKTFEGAVAQWDKYLGDESEDIAKKYKGDKALYAAGLLRGVAPKPENKDAALVALYRAAVLDPRNAAIPRRIAQLQGNGSAAPEPKPKGKGKKG
ncbi:MAG: hypothetical protein U0P81_03920 [Holophagaceae bacterium]